MARTLETTPSTTAAPPGDRRKWWVLVAMVFGLFMPMLDNLVVNVALPTIQVKLGSGVSGLQWIIDAYTLTFASFMLTGGALMAWIVVRESRDQTRSRRLDPPGLVTGTAGLFFLVFALIEGNDRGWTDGLILGSFALSAVLLVTFFVIESRREYPMLPLSFFRIPTFAAANVVAASVFFALFGSTFFLS